MTQIKNLSTQRIRQLINQTSTILVELTNELDRREQAQQEYEIEDLEGHMTNAEVSLQTVRDFISCLTTDLKSAKQTNKSD